MASLNMFFSPAAAINNSTINTTRTTRRVQTFATAAKGSGGSTEEKGFFEWLAGAIVKDQLVETDPILQKVEGKSSGGTVGKKSTTAAPPKKSDGGNGGFGGLGGLFAKK